MRDESKITSRSRAESVGVTVTYIGGHEKSRIGDFKKLFRKTNEEKFSFRLIEREDVS